MKRFNLALVVADVTCLFRAQCKEDSPGAYDGRPADSRNLAHLALIRARSRCLVPLVVC